MGRTRSPQHSFTFVGLVPLERAVAHRALAVEVLERLRELEAAERCKAANGATPLATRARHDGVATGISIALAAIEASG